MTMMMGVPLSVSHELNLNGSKKSVNPWLDELSIKCAGQGRLTP